MRRSAAATKAVILAAARERFAADGYEKATIRAVAAEAGVDPAMVMRYFGSKEKLFATAAEFDLRLPDLSQVSRERLGETIIRHFLERWRADDGLQVLLRTGVTNEAAAQRMREIFRAQLAPMIVASAGDRAATKAALVASQVLGMALCRYILKLPPTVDMSDEEVIEWLAPTLQPYLTSE
ncbi:TetR family transcriptional regulator [Nonomuraea basaltis]|uniref:TetR/AcrR family transcriptional regulator n=1 Tax=Nonomuraea basaltis TaxID=2495887 RepID=UPI00110C5825|nr:TetR family transcriptional regulator [Nonomuraea basaltis]TMR92699.1 TetR/AcrR family transcriptional regulator [Nonomuraea basaltis]